MGRPRSFDEDDVVAAARDQFWNRGYAATSVEDLTEVTGLGKGSLYGAFGDKHTLFVRALDRYCDDALDRIVAQLHRPGVAAYDRLTDHVRAMVADIVADTDRRGCMMGRMSAELGAEDPEVEAVVCRTLTRWCAELVDVIREAQCDGAVRADVDPQVSATMMLGVIRGLDALRGGGIHPEQISAAAEQALTFLVRRAEKPSG